MDGLHEIIPAAVPIEIDGRTWQLGPLLLADYAEMDRFLLQKRHSPLEGARAAMPTQSEQEIRHLLSLAFDEERRRLKTTCADMQAWLSSAEGTLYEFWLRLRGRQPNMTLAVVARLFADRTAEISGTMAIAARRTGEYPLGNAPSRGRNSTHPAAACRFLGARFSAA
jgi:hypothetical protein